MIVTKVPQIDWGMENKKVYLEPTPAHFTKVLPTTTPGSTNFGSISFVAPAPSRTVFTDRRIRIKAGLTLTFTKAVGGNNILAAGLSAPRAFPLQSIIQSVNINIDNQAYTFLPSKMIHPLSHYHSRNLDTDAPAYLDKYQVYANGSGRNINSLATYGDSRDHNISRGGTTFTVTTNTPTQAVVVIDIWEMLYIPPFTNHFDQQLGLTNYSNMDFTFVFASDIGRVWSDGTANAPYTSVVPTWSTQPALYIDYYTNSADYVPRPFTYKTDQFAIQLTAGSNGNTLAAGATQDFQSNSFQFSVIPNKIYIWVQTLDTVKTMADPDVYARINNISLSFGNVTGILSSADTHTLYMMSHKNGLVDSFPEWYGEHTSATITTKVGGVGSVLCLEMGSDIPMTAGFHPGMAGSFNFQVTRMSVTNPDPAHDMQYPYLYCLFQIDGYTHMGDTVVRETGLATVPSSDIHPTPYNSVSEYYGAGLLDRVGQLMPYLQKANQFLKDYKIISTVASQIPHPTAQVIGHAAKQLGYGDPYDGGRMLTTGELKNRLHRLQ